MTFRITTSVVATALMLAAAPAFAAENGTTLAGPAQGTKSDGSSSMTPSAESGANSGAMMKSGGGSMSKSGSSMMKSGSTGGTATGPQ